VNLKQQAMFVRWFDDNRMMPMRKKQNEKYPEIPRNADITR